MYNPSILQDRAFMLSKVRSFFSKRKIIEVDPPAITKCPAIDHNIALMKTYVIDDVVGYLHTSPEYCMKRLLSTYGFDIYFLGHVYRKNEIGQIHNPEFTMIEWYRKNISYENFLDEIVSLIKLFLPSVPIKKSSYRDLLYKHTNIDPINGSFSEILSFVKKHIDIQDESLTRDDLLNLILSHLIEPTLGQNELFILDEYPKTQAALAKIDEKKQIAERFEFYYKGIELANGFHELNDEKEQRSRLISNNKDKLPIDEKFLSSLNGIGDCYGVAVGFDRLMMLKHDLKSISESIPFSWEET